MSAVNFVHMDTGAFLVVIMQSFPKIWHKQNSG